jgi:molecular chaperone GrpE
MATQQGSTTPTPHDGGLLGRLSGSLEHECCKAAELALVGFLRELLPLLDDLEDALHSVPDYIEHVPRARLEFLQRDLRALLNRTGVCEIVAEPGSPVDPRLHEVVGHDDSSELPEDHVAHLAVKGYRLNDHVLRRAQVITGRRQPAQAHDPLPLRPAA